MIEDLVRRIAALERRLDGLVRPEVGGGLKRVAEYTATGSVASISLSGFPSTFRHLLLLAQLRTDRAAEGDAANVRFNGDTGSNYDYIIWQFPGSGAAAGAVGRAQAEINSALQTAAANARANTLTPAVAWILNYAATDLEKDVISNNVRFGDLSADADLVLSFRGGHWRSQNAITSITLIPAIGANFVAGGRVSLYGVL